MDLLFGWRPPINCASAKPKTGLVHTDIQTQIAHNSYLIMTDSDTTTHSPSSSSSSSPTIDVLEQWIRSAVAAPKEQGITHLVCLMRDAHQANSYRIKVEDSLLEKLSDRSTVNVKQDKIIEFTLDGRAHLLVYFLYDYKAQAMLSIAGKSNVVFVPMFNAPSHSSSSAMNVSNDEDGADDSGEADYLGKGTQGQPSTSNSSSAKYPKVAAIADHKTMQGYTRCDGIIKYKVKISPETDFIWVDEKDLEDPLQVMAYWHRIGKRRSTYPWHGRDLNEIKRLRGLVMTGKLRLPIVPAN